jgi:hypothetical protein
MLGATEVVVAVDNEGTILVLEPRQPARPLVRLR